jgi:hypothetical protein
VVSKAVVINSELVVPIAKAEWGTIPDWVTAFGTLAAFFVALRLLAKELAARREYEEDRRRDQARLVNAWLAYKTYGRRPGRVAGKNRSEKSVYDLTATTVTAGSPWVSDPESLWLGSDEDLPDASPDLRKVHAQRIQWPILNPGETREYVSSDPDSSHGYVVIGLFFTDSRGRLWKRLPNGTLTEVALRR